MTSAVTPTQTARWTRRRTVSLLGSAGGVFLAACGASGPGSGTETKTRAPVTLRSWIFQPGNPEPNDGTSAAVAAIKEKYPHITFADEGKGAANQAYVDAVVTAAVASSLPDLLYAQGPQIQGFIRNGAVRALDDFLAKDKSFDLKDFPDVGLKVYQAGGKQYAIPYDHGPHLLWFNKTLFDKEGVKLPDSAWTMNDMVEAARRLNKPESGQWGTNFAPNGGYPLQATWLGPWGGKYLNDDETDVLVDSKESLEALEFWYDLRAKRHYSPMPGESVDWWTGKLAMKNTGPWDYRGYLSRKPDFVADIADWPKGPKGRAASSMGSGYPISSQTKVPEDAWLFLSEYLGKDENRSILSQFVKTGAGTPVRYSLLSKWEKSPFAPPSAKIVAPALKEYSQVGRPITPLQADLNKVVNDALNAVWAGQQAMAQAVKQIKQLAAPILEQNKKK
ncbi:MAG TPA: sugar ABC transporter substrate-binding protein [Chloroflexota bacterium]|nr:sugar ABC transporter substrate-binding protein [Chloroflexota bacterium]